MPLPRLVISAGKASADGFYHLRYPAGDALPQPAPVFDYSAGFPAADQSQFVYTNDADYPLFNGTSLVVIDGTVGTHEASGSWYGTKVDVTSFTTEFTFDIGVMAVSGEAVASGDGTSTGPFTHKLQYVPRAGTVSVTDGTSTGTDDGAGNISGSGVSGTIDYRSQQLSVTFTSPPAAGTNNITCSYSAPSFGMGLVLHNDPKGTGASGDANGLGFMTYTFNNPDNAIHNSVGVMFNTSAGAVTGTSMVGCYLNGGPFVNGGIYPLQDMSRQGIDLFAGNTMNARVVYDGTVLTLTLTDTVTGKKARFDWPVDIPAVVGANTAYIGFGGGTIPAGPEMVPGWVFSNGVAPRLAAPTFSVAAGQYATAQTVSILPPNVAPDSVTMYYTTDGTPPTDASSKYTAPISVSATTIVQAIAVSQGYEDSFVASALYSIQATASPVVNFPGGFSGASGLIRTAGTAAFNGSAIELIDGGYQGEIGSAFFCSPVDISTFSTTFELTFTPAVQAAHNGMAFVIANQGESVYNDVVFGLASAPAANSLTATLSSAWVGPSATYSVRFSDGETRLASVATNGTTVDWTATGSPLANAVAAAIYVGRTIDTCVSGGPYSIGDGGPSGEPYGTGNFYGFGGIGNGIAVVFDEWNNKVGLSIGGQAPLLTAVTGLTIGANPLSCSLTYDGTTLSLQIEDTVTLATFSTNWLVDIPTEVGASTAYVGFTASCYDSQVAQRVTSWTY